ncbi:MAG TPA: TetR/AcrR family transcriptional regulator, partial [Flammeovirgaceae bacterium]|nr:TetR/AcrR family transcriptional regulator [Flammeovirgaceae bacterium]
MKKSDNTKTYIIERVAPVFNKKGFTGTYLSDLEKVTGLTKGSIYGNFKDKNEVALEAFKYNFKQLSDKIQSNISNARTPKEKLWRFIEFYNTEYENIISKGGCPILNTAVDADDGNEILKTAVKKAIIKWIKLIENILAEGIKN